MWRKLKNIFGEIAQEYDAWYDQNPLFLSEIKALRALGEVPSPGLEIGVGTGVFAKALGFKYGLDPSPEMLSLAQKKGIFCICGVGEKAPFKDHIFKACGLFFTLCFVSDPRKVIRECRRILTSGGLLFLGFIPQESPWGKFYEEKARRGHRIYRWAHFRKGEEILLLLKRERFSILKGYSSLFQPPSTQPYEEEPQEGLWPEAGFWAVLAIKN